MPSDVIRALYPVPPAIQMEPSMQLTIYESTNRNAHNVTYIEHTPIVLRKKRSPGPGPATEYVPGTPGPLLREHLAHIARELLRYIAPAPPYFGYGHLLGYKPSQAGVRLLWYSEGGDRYVNFAGTMGDLGSGTVNLPRTVLSVHDRSLDVFCLPDGPITPQTPLLMSPYPNTNDMGGVCTGSATAPKGSDVPSIDELMRRWEVLFFYSEFTHFGGRGEGGNVARPERVKMSLGELWKSLMVEKSRFPIELLHPDPKGRTVGDLQLLIANA